MTLPGQCKELEGVAHRGYYNGEEIIACAKGFL
jgi:hypothetical protein